MKSKLTLIAILALGALSIVPGTGFAADGSAGSAQYAPEEETHFCEENGGTEGASGCEYPCVEEDGSAGETSAPSPGQPCEHQETQPTQSAPPPPPASLPRTGFPVAPALLVGVGLLGIGALMRLRLRSDSLA